MMKTKRHEYELSFWYRLRELGWTLQRYNTKSTTDEDLVIRGNIRPDDQVHAYRPFRTQNDTYPAFIIPGERDDTVVDPGKHTTGRPEVVLYITNDDESIYGYHRIALDLNAADLLNAYWAGFTDGMDAYESKGTEE